jgi:prevent-host-death family protein
MISLPLAEAKNRLSELIVHVENGKDVAITRRGKPVARLVPIENSEESAHNGRIKEAFRQLRLMRFDTESDDDLKAIAREGADQ